MNQPLQHDFPVVANSLSHPIACGGGWRNLTCWSLGLLASLSLPALATNIQWSAAGTVSTVSGGFAVAVGDPVTVRFSYDSAPTLKTISEFMFPTGAVCEFCDAIALVMEVSIGTQVWSGRVPTSPPDGTLALTTEAWNSSGLSSEKFTILASSADAGSFAPFPYTGTIPDRSIQVVLTDATPPYGFLTPKVLPKTDTAVSEITAGSGFVAAGTDRINFSLSPASVTVIGVEPAFALKVTQTTTGFELRWPSVIGKSYRLEEGDTLADWQPYNTYPGTGAEIVVALEPFTAHPQRHFYRVVKVE